MVDAEWDILYDKLEQIHASGASIALSKLPIDEVATGNGNNVNGVEKQEMSELKFDF